MDLSLLKKGTISVNRATVGIPPFPEDESSVFERYTGTFMVARLSLFTTLVGSDVIIALVGFTASSAILYTVEARAKERVCMVVVVALIQVLIVEVMARVTNVVTKVVEGTYRSGPS
ncbi:hypothetical protein IPA_01200 [Ignicoccus pacificus DSM 13166]|uniref:Uncharacterized protein n=1 Tax=Ignicoccus pacificus DSM 13166 TaxID=940294 RepID=A0A977KAG4_9CREN|nr:hypothetical protein IPA_01200 [Ignicoccus pacificus DSM 13166]